MVVFNINLWLLYERATKMKNKIHASPKGRKCKNVVLISDETTIYNSALTGLTYYILNFIGLTAYAIK